MTAPSPRPTPAERPSLADAVAVGLDTLGNLVTLRAIGGSEGVEAILRQALADHQRRHTSPVNNGAANPPRPSERAAAAVCAACAHLASHSFEDAYLALLTATDHLGVQRPEH